MAAVRLSPLVRRCLTVTAFAGLALASCKRQDELPPAQPQYAPQSAYPYPQQPQPAPWAPPPGYGPAPRSSPPPMTPAFGFFCATDFDMQCPYGRCLGGRCGGCADASQCKPGATCAPSPVGGTCWPGGAGNVPPPAPAPAPRPGPTPSQPPPPFPAPPSAPPASQDPFAAARQSCVDRINQYRARVRVAPVSRDPSSEPCDDEESRLDARSNRPHGSFGKCGERAQNACPNYPGASVEDILTKCLQQMFDEGPGGGHYDNMTSTKYTRASCGFEAMPGGRIWTVQNFFK